MSQTENFHNNPNPFLTSKADELWQRLDNNGNRVSKKELVKRAEALKKKDSR